MAETQRTALVAASATNILAPLEHRRARVAVVSEAHPDGAETALGERERCLRVAGIAARVLVRFGSGRL